MARTGVGDGTTHGDSPSAASRVNHKTPGLGSEAIMPKHIVRLIGLIIAFLVVAFAAKSYFTVDSFYRFGHYRANSVPQIASQAPVYQTPAYCKSCHAERHAQWSGGNHKTVICEVCHGAAQGHPQNGKLPIPSDTVRLCTLCHEAMTGRPSTGATRSAGSVRLVIFRKKSARPCCSDLCAGFPQ